MFALISQAFAGTVVIDGNVNARSSKDFRSTKNLTAVLSKGTEGEILAHELFPSGSYALQIRITKLGDSASNNLKTGDSVWIYYHKKPKVRYIEVFNDEHIKQEDPGQGKWAQVEKTFKIHTEVNHTVAKPKKQISAHCVNCTKETTPPIIDNTNVQGEIDSLQKLEKEQMPEITPYVEELAQYIERLTSHDSFSENDSIENNRIISATMIQSCKDYHVPLQMALAVATQESGFRPHPEDQKKPVHHHGKLVIPATGVMQMLHRTELGEAIAVGLIPKGSTSVPYEVHRKIENNVRMGVHYLSECIKAFPNDQRKQFMAYFLGIGGAHEALAGKASPYDWHGYVRSVSSFMKAYQHFV